MLLCEDTTKPTKKQKFLRQIGHSKTKNIRNFVAKLCFMKKLGNGWFHVLAIFAVLIWGTTFVATKMLITAGLHPTEIFIYRFIIAYVCILFISPRKLWSDSWRDEALLFLSGITGGPLYFITENTALQYTQAVNVAMIISGTPLLTTLLAMAIFRSERTRNPLRIIVGSVIALAGVIVVIYHGNVDLKFNPIGDVLTLCAAASWAVYSILLKVLGKKYSAVFLTRKVFAYGLLSMALWLPFHPERFDLALLTKPEVLANVLFLGALASMLCFTIWTAVVNRLGTVKSTNYINLNPIVTFVSAYFFLGEVVTPLSLLGAAAIIGGVYVIER